MSQTAPLGPREWDAVGYDSLDLPHRQWGQWVLGALALRGDERVVDLGAGTGRDTATLLQRLPRGHVIAVDASTAMLAALRGKLADADPARLSVRRADLEAPLNLGEPVDAVVSVATLHWLRDHQSLFRRIYGLLRPGGVFRAEWGGAGNVANVDAVLAEQHAPRVAEMAHYTTVEQTRRRLATAGFVDVYVETVTGMTVVASDDQWDMLLRSVVLGPVLDQLPPEQHAPLLNHVTDRVRDEGVRYVRLHTHARRPADRIAEPSAG